jgi:hypothetical protein
MVSGVTEHCPEGNGSHPHRIYPLIRTEIMKAERMNPMSTDENRTDHLWIDGVFLALFLVEWGVMLFLLALKPITGRLMFAVPFLWGPVVAIFIAIVVLPYLLYQIWLLYRKFRLGHSPYRPRLRRVSLLVFALTFPITYVTGRLMVWMGG